MLNDILYDLIRNDFHDFDDFTSKEKHDLSNRYFDDNLSGQPLELIEKSLNHLIKLKQQILPDIKYSDKNMKTKVINPQFPLE
jgi:hypothetical protein